MVVPAAPALVAIKEDSLYNEALQTADIVIPDSGYMTLLWNLTHKIKLNRISGLEFLLAFLNDEEIKKTKNILLIDPREFESEANRKYLNAVGFELAENASYVAPVYDKAKVEDPVLLRLVTEKKPKYIIINLGGGVQEKLGAYLRSNLDYKPGIICTGAAIAFLTGNQAKIPRWADRHFIGWLFRCFEKPGIYVPRYLKAFKLLTLMLRYGEATPLRG